MKKSMKQILSLLLVALMAVSLFSITAFATEIDPPEETSEPEAASAGTPSITIKPNDTEGVAEGPITITYTYYKILSAAIEQDPVVNEDGETTTHGKVAYFVLDANQAAALEGTGVFTVTRVGDTDKWYVELVEGKVIDDILTAFNNDEFLANFDEQTYTNSEGGDATLPNITAGYYFIKSSLGSKIAIQTLSPVVINEKNEYVSDEKTIPADDENSQIGQDVVYTLTVNVPATATEEIVLTDTMGVGLTFKAIEQDANITGTVSDVAPAVDAETGDNIGTKFTITYAADDVKALVADGAATITVKVTVTVNEDAVIDTGIPNTLDLKYGNNYEAVPSTVETETTSFKFDKIDGTDKSRLTGAEFELQLDGTALALVELEEGVRYRIATPAEVAADEEAEGEDKATTTVIKTVGKLVTVEGVDADLTYQLVETKAPTGYNKLSSAIDVEPDPDSVVTIEVENNKGAELPTTGGIGTTIFYVVGSLLVVGAGAVLVTKKRMGKDA